jgi:hypothetical protein
MLLGHFIEHAGNRLDLLHALLSDRRPLGGRHATGMFRVRRMVFVALLIEMFHGLLTRLLTMLTDPVDGPVDDVDPISIEPINSVLTGIVFLKLN